MTGVVVWSYMNNRNLWSPYEPDVSCELERLFVSGTQQTVNLGTVSPNLSCYDVNFALMKQTTNSSGSVRDIKRSFHGPTSALGQGVVWEYEGELPSQWNVYDMETMELLEEHFTRRNHLNSSVFDLQQTRLRLPYIIDFSNMTQMRVDTGKVRQIKRRSMKQHFSPIPAQSLSTSFPAMSTSAVYTVPSGQPNWQPGQLQLKSVAGRSKYRQQPYSLSKSRAHGHFHGSNGLVGLPAHSQQQNLQQQSSQNPGPVTRKKVQQTTHTAPAPTLHQNMQTQHPTAQSAYSSPQQQLYFQQQALQNLHIGSYQHTSGFAQGSHQSYQYPSSTLTQTYTLSPLTIMAPALEHQRSNGTSTSSSSSLMPTCGSHTSQSLPNVTKVTIGKSKKSKSKTGQQVLETFMRSIHTDLDKSDCSICFDKLSEPSSYGEGRADACVAVELIRCGHQYHKLCLLEMHRSIHKDDSLQCPSCKTIYGEKTGICPPGYMQWKLVHDLTLSGYEGHGTIIVSYHIHSGTQGPEHPSPGQSYSARGFPRQGFLPDCDKGRKVLKLLMEAFRRRLMFTIATSHTTGESNTVTWNEIHHKTEPSGNTTGHGYPDPNYLDNVLMELAAHGVTEDCLT